MLWGIAVLSGLALGINLIGTMAASIKMAAEARQNVLIASAPDFAARSAATLARNIVSSVDPAGRLGELSHEHRDEAFGQLVLGQAANLAIRQMEAEGHVDLAVSMSRTWIREAPALAQLAFAGEAEKGARFTAGIGGASTAETRMPTSLTARTLNARPLGTMPERRVLMLYLSNVLFLATGVLAAGLALANHRRQGAGELH
ncbi:sensory box/GGDEF protein [Tepidicaulis marinus]|uniref:Sensory box/GGDEF protein n=1 Tax=Tepidicaulis marinus TaxID=1333998 RepID=A0A081BBR8_9HYPH|nr:sensory box/GGDEF protein [Tepidicaulis marinus]